MSLPAPHHAQRSLSIDELRRQLDAARQQHQICENAWFTAQQVLVAAGIPGPLPRQGGMTMDSVVNGPAYDLAEIKAAAERFAGIFGYLKQAWEWRIHELRELLRGAGVHA